MKTVCICFFLSLLMAEAETRSFSKAFIYYTVSVKGAAPYARFKKQIKWEDDIEY